MTRMQNVMTVRSARIIGAMVAGAMLLGSVSVASAYHNSGSSVTVRNSATVTNVSTAVANTGFNRAGGGDGAGCTQFCTGGEGSGGIVVTGNARSTTWTANFVNWTGIFVN